MDGRAVATRAASDLVSRSRSQAPRHQDQNQGKEVEAHQTDQAQLHDTEQCAGLGCKPIHGSQQVWADQNLNKEDKR